MISFALVSCASVMEACLHGEEQVIYGDKAFAEQTRKERAEAAEIKWRMRPQGGPPRQASNLM